MADIPNRDELERQYARLMGRLLAAYGGHLLEKLGDPPSLDNIPPDFWDDEAKGMIEKLRPFGNRVFTEAAQRLMDEIGVGVDWTVINEAAADWASRYTFELVSNITNTNRDKLRSAIDRYYRDGWKLGELIDNIKGQYSPVRAEMIAVTEVTRAASEGEIALANEVRQAGVVLTAIWNTNNDDLVCPLCGPLNQRREDRPGAERPTWTHPETGQVFGPPPDPHPRCRCWVGHEATMRSET